MLFPIGTPYTVMEINMQISELLEKLKVFNPDHLVMIDTEDFLHSVITVKYDPVAQAVVIANYPEHRSSPFGS